MNYIIHSKLLFFASFFGDSCPLDKRGVLSKYCAPLAQILSAPSNPAKTVRIYVVFRMARLWNTDLCEFGFLTRYGINVRVCFEANSIPLESILISQRTLCSARSAQRVGDLLKSWQFFYETHGKFQIMRPSITRFVGICRLFEQFMESQNIVFRKYIELVSALYRKLSNR